MKNFQTEYQLSVNRHPVPDKLIENTKIRMEKEMIHHKKSKMRWAVAIPICAIVVLFSVTAVASGMVQSIYRFSKSAYEGIFKQGVSDEILSKAGNNVQETVDKSGLEITVNKTICDNQLMYLLFDVKSKNGAPLQESSEFRKSILPQERFDNPQLTIDGEKYDCYMFRIDDASIPDQAKYEAQIYGDFTDKNGLDAVLELGDLKDNVNTCEDAGFLFDNLSELYHKMTPEKSENFIKTGIYAVYAGGETVPSWTIPAGKNKVKFSSQFPKSYIDNIGFHKTGEKGCECDYLYISITPGNEKEAEELKNLCFQNTETKNPVFYEDWQITGTGFIDTGFKTQEERKKLMHAEQKEKLKMNGNRIVIALNIMHDTHTNRDCTLEDLKNYRIAKNFGTDRVLRYPGHWKIPFKVKFTDTTRVFNINKQIPFDKADIDVKKITLSDLNFSITGKINLEDKKIPITQFKLIYADGTKVDVGPKIGGGIDSDGTFEFSGRLWTLVDSKKVTAIELWGNRVELK